MTEVLPVWQLALPLPAVLLITVGLYMLLLGAALWVRYCLKDRCSVSCSDCCPDVSLCDQCFKMAEVCDCGPPSMRSCLPCPASCPTPSECRCPMSERGRYDPGSVWSLQTLSCPCPVLCPCSQLDCACTCQPPECDTCNCLCFEIRIK